MVRHALHGRVSRNELEHRRLPTLLSNVRCNRVSKNSLDIAETFNLLSHAVRGIVENRMM